MTVAKESYETSVPTPEPKDVVTAASEVLPFSAAEIDAYDCAKAEISKGMKNIRDACFEIGQRLYYIDMHQLYKLDNFTSTAKLAKAKWGIIEKDCSNYLNFCKCFGIIDEATHSCRGLQERYMAYSESQLEELLPIARKCPERLNEFSEDMTRDQIRAKKGLILTKKKKPKKGTAPKSKKLPATKPANIRKAAEESEPTENEPAEVCNLPAPAQPKRKAKKRRQLLRASDLAELNRNYEEIQQEVRRFCEEYHTRDCRFYLFVEVEENA